jgi:hypothetical protein
LFLTYRHYLLKFFFFLILRLFPLDSKIIPANTANGNNNKNTNIKGFSKLKRFKYSALLLALDPLVIEELVLEVLEFELFWVLIALFEGVFIELTELITLELLLDETTLLELLEL